MRYYGIIRDLEHVFPDRLTDYFDTYDMAKAEAESLCHHLMGRRGKVLVDMVLEIPIKREVRAWWTKF